MSSSKMRGSGGGQTWDAKPFDDREFRGKAGYNSGSEPALFFRIEPGTKKAVETDGYRDWRVEGVELSREEWSAELERKALLAKKKGYEEGLKKGRADGYEAGRQELSGLIDDFFKAISQLAGQKEALLRETEDGLIELALTAAKKIVDQELALNEDAAISIVKAAIKAAVDREQLRMRVNPSFLNAIMGHKPQLQSFLDGINNLAVEEDESLEPGDCVIETLYGVVDARISSQLDQMREAVRKTTAQGDSTAEDKDGASQQ